MKKRFELLARSEVLPPFRKELRQLLASAGWDKKKMESILLATDEALTNVIRHAYGAQEAGSMIVEVDDSPEKTEIILEDQGRKFDPTRAPAPELPRHKPGGLGIHFIRTIMDEIIYDEGFRDGNRLHLIKWKKT